MTAKEIREKLSHDIFELNDRDTYAVAALVNELLEPPLSDEELAACKKFQHDLISGDFSDYVPFENVVREIDLLNEMENHNRKTSSEISLKAV